MFIIGSLAELTLLLLILIVIGLVVSVLSALGPNLFLVFVFGWTIFLVGRRLLKGGKS